MGNRWQEAVWDPRKGPLIFMVGGYLLGISINLASNAVSALAQRHISVGLFFGIGGPVALLLISSSLLRGRRLVPVPFLAKPARSKGLVVIASHGEGIETSKKAIVYHHPDQLWAVHSEWSEPDFQALKAWAIDQRFVREERIVPIALSNTEFIEPGIIQDSLEREVFGKLPEGWGEADVMIDISGGRKQTSAGAFLAGLLPGRRLEVNMPEKTDDNVRGTVPGDPVEISLDYKLKKVRRP
jgi:hypothetical protein